MISERKQPVTVRSMSQSAGPLRFLNFESKAYKLLVNPAYTSINGSCTRICSIGPLKYGKKKNCPSIYTANHSFEIFTYFVPASLSPSPIR